MKWQDGVYIYDRTAVAHALIDLVKDAVLNRRKTQMIPIYPEMTP